MVCTENSQANVPDDGVDIHRPRAAVFANAPEPRHDLPGDVSSDVVLILERGEKGGHGRGRVREREGDEVCEEKLEDCREMRGGDWAEFVYAGGKSERDLGSVAGRCTFEYEDASIS